MNHVRSTAKIYQKFNLLLKYIISLFTINLYERI